MTLSLARYGEIEPVLRWASQCGQPVSLHNVVVSWTIELFQLVQSGEQAGTLSQVI